MASTPSLATTRARPQRALDDIETEDNEARYRPIDFNLIRRLSRQLVPYKWRYVLGISLSTVMVVLELQSPRFMMALINNVTAFLAGAPGAAQTHSEATWQAVLIVVAWAAVLATAVILHRFSVLTMAAAGERVQFDLRRRIFAHLQKLSMSYYDKTRLGRIISRCTSDINGLREVNVFGLDHLVKNAMMMIVAAIMMLVYTDWRLFVAVAWLGPVLLLINRIYRRRIGFRWQIVREGFTRVSTNLAENITGMRVVTAFNRQTPNLGVFNDLQAMNTANNVLAARINGLYQPALQSIGILGKIIILAYGAYLIATDQIGPIGVGGVVAAFLYWDWFMNPIVNFGNFYNQLMMAMAGAERVFNLLDTQPEVQDLPGARPLPRISGHVQFENVTFGYNPDIPVLHDVSFDAKPGQMIALVGATGSGKSSIISLIARFYQPQSGRILVDGHDIRYVTGDSLHKQTGLVLQVNYLFSGTVFDNIRYPRPKATHQEVINAAIAIGSHEAIMNLPQGYHTDVGERGENMSLGQRQLICFTRAFLADPRIFMLDEATSAVDTATELLIQRSLEKLLEGRTTFVVAHRLSTIMKADQILVIHEGRIVERGTHRQLLDAGGKYAHLYRQFVLQSE